MTRRDWLAAAGLTVAGCTRRALGGYPGVALVALSGETSLAVVDLLHFRLRAPIPLEAPPTQVLGRPDSHASYALTPSTGSVHAINARLERTQTSKLADELAEINLSPSDKLLAFSASARELVIADGHTLAPLQRIKLSGVPRHMDVSRTGDIAISLSQQRAILLISPDGKLRQIVIDGEPDQVRFRSDGKLLIVTRPADRVLTALSVPDLHVLAHLPLAMEPRNLCFTPDGGQLFVTGPGMDGMAIVFPYNTLEVEQTILVGRKPGCMACVNSPEYLFVADSTASAVTVVRVPTRDVMALIEVGLRPGFITLTPDNQYALILDQGSGDMAVVHIPAIRIDPTRIDRKKRGAALFTLLPVGANPVCAAVVPYRSV